MKDLQRHRVHGAPPPPTGSLEDPLATLFAYTDPPHYEPERARIFLDDVRLRCLAAGRPDLALLADRALARARAARDLELSREASRTHRDTVHHLARLDAELDRLNSLIWRWLAQAVEAGSLHPLSAAAAGLREAAYPRGIRGQVQSSYVEKADLHLRAADALRHGSAAPVVDGLMLRLMVDRLAELAVAFNAALRPPPPPVSYADVRAAIGLANEHALRAILGIAATFDPDLPEELARREELLLPVRLANEDIRARGAAQRKRSAAARPGSARSNPALNAEDAELSRRHAKRAAPLPASASNPEEPLRGDSAAA